MAGTALIAFGVVFVLLLGEIDLSVAYVSGLCAVVAAEPQLPDGADLPGLVAMPLAVLVGVAIGAFQGSFVALIGVPSFVVTLAGFLMWQGVIIRASRGARRDHHPGRPGSTTRRTTSSATGAGWILAIDPQRVYVLAVLSGYTRTSATGFRRAIRSSSSGWCCRPR